MGKEIYMNQFVKVRSGLLQPQMGLLRQQLELYVKQMAVEAESQFESFEANIQTQINDLLAFDFRYNTYQSIER